jgi:hypothetical protein
MFPINCALKFKYLPLSHLKVNTCLLAYFCDEIFVFLQVNLHYMVSQVGAKAVQDRTNPVCIPTFYSTETGLIVGCRIPCQVTRWKLPQQVRMTESMFSHGCHQTACSLITTTKAQYSASPESACCILLSLTVECSTLLTIWEVLDHIRVQRSGMLTHFLWFSSGFSRECSNPFTLFCIDNLISLNYRLIYEKFKTLWYEAVSMCILQQTLKYVKSPAITLGTHGGKKQK